MEATDYYDYEYNRVGIYDVTYEQFNRCERLREMIYDFTQHPHYDEFVKFFMNQIIAWGHEGRDVEKFAKHLTEFFIERQEESVDERPEKLHFCTLLELYLDAYYDFDKHYPKSNI